MNRKHNEIVDVSVILHHQTPKAVLVSDDGNEKRAKWIPKSVVEIDVADPCSGQAITVTMPYWVAKDKGFI